MKVFENVDCKLLAVRATNQNWHQGIEIKNRILKLLVKVILLEIGLGFVYLCNKVGT